MFYLARRYTDGRPDVVFRGQSYATQAAAQRTADRKNYALADLGATKFRWIVVL